MKKGFKWILTGLLILSVAVTTACGGGGKESSSTSSSSRGGVTSSSEGQSGLNSVNSSSRIEQSSSSFSSSSQESSVLKVMTGIEFKGATVEYDTLPHSIEIMGNIPNGAIVKYYYNNVETTEVTEVGNYNVEVVITHPEYEDFRATAVLKITSKEERLFSLNHNGTIYFQNNLDSNKFYKYESSELSKVNNDIPTYMIANGNDIYYYGTGLFNKNIKSFDGNSSSTIYQAKGEYLTTDGTYIYWAINNKLFNTAENGIYKLQLNEETAVPTRISTDKAEYLTIYDGKMYYSNLSNGKKLCVVNLDGTDQTGTVLLEDKISDIIIDDGVLYYNSSTLTHAAICKYTISSGTQVRLTTDAGRYLTKIGNYVYYINVDLLTSNVFGKGIYKVSALKDEDSSMIGEKVLSSEDDAFSSLTSDGTNLYYYRLNDKHFYKFTESSEVETDLMQSFVVEEDTTLLGFAKLAEYQGEIYYTNPLEEGAIYKVNPTTKTKVKVLDGNVSGIYFHNGYMYYSTYITVNYALWRMDLETQVSVKISSDRCDNLIFDGETIYFVKVGSMYNNHIMKMNLDGTGVTELYSDKNLWVADLYKVNNNIFFTINPSLWGSKKLYKLNLENNQATDLGVVALTFTISGNTIYFYDNDKSIYSCGLDGSNPTQIATNVEVNELIVYNNQLIYSSTKTNVGLYSYNLINKETTKLGSTNADGMIVANGNLYFIQTAISYTSDYPSHSSGNDGKLYYYNGQLRRLG